MTTTSLPMPQKSPTIADLVTLPKAVELEQAIVAAILVDASAFPIIKAIFKDPYVFSNPKNRLIFQACLHLANLNQPIDLLTVYEEIKRRGKANICAPSYLTELSQKMAATVKLDPVPMYAYRDSTATMWQHHLIIEGQRKTKKGLIGGIKKYVVLSANIKRDPRGNRVAIYGWHRMDGILIQPLYVGHVNTYVDYSHGIRLVWRRMKVDGKWIDYKESWMMIY